MKKIVFSATGRTVKAADRLCKTWENIDFIDLSRNDFENITINTDELCFVAVPVYGGYVPLTACENLAKINAGGAKAVIMVVYGNRAYDGALAQLKDICTKSGFVVSAAVAAVAEHSMMPRVAHNRPDSEDVKQLSGWGKQIMDLYKSGKLPADVSVPGTAGSGDGKIPLHPKADKSCTGCGLCADKCPAVAISKQDPTVTDAGKCITCMRCVEICPNNSRSMFPGVLKLAGGVMKKVWGKRNPNELFIG